MTASIRPTISGRPLSASSTDFEPLGKDMCGLAADSGCHEVGGALRISGGSGICLGWVRGSRDVGHVQRSLGQRCADFRADSCLSSLYDERSRRGHGPLQDTGCCTDSAASPMPNRLCTACLERSGPKVRLARVRSRRFRTCQPLRAQA